MDSMEGGLQAACAVHPERPALQICGRCGTFACEQCLGDSPAGETLCSACVAREATSLLPWDYREELGIFRAWIRSVGPIMLRPGTTFASARRDGDVAGAFLFSGIANFLGYFTTFAAFAAFGAVVPMPSTGEVSGVPVRGYVIAVYGSMALFAPLFGLVATVIMAAMDHVVLRVIGKPRSFETTLRAAALSQAPLVIGLIPFCSLYIAPFWVLVAKVFAYKGLHRTTTGVAVAGALLAPIVAAVAFCGLYALIIFAAMGMVAK